jgi:tetratricopeptide (TPR) repeat protein
MKFPLMKLVLSLAVAAAFCFAQAPAAKPPKAKSKSEAEAYKAIFNAPTPDDRIALSKDLITKYADTEYKENALQVIATSYQQKNDAENTVVWAEKCLEVNPKNFVAMLLIATSLAQRTREFDLDKEEKLTRADKLANEAIELVKTAPKPGPQIPDEQWEMARKDYQAEGHEALGMSAMVRKKYDVAQKEFEASLALTPQPDPAVEIRLGVAQYKDGKFDAAVANFDKVMADPQSVPIIKQAAQSEKAKALAAKASAAQKK